MMKELKREWQTVVEALKAVTQETEEIIKKLDKLENTRVVQRVKVKPKTPKRRVPMIKVPAKASIDAVMEAIKRSREGIDTEALKKETGFDETELRIIIFNLRKQGRIRRVFVPK